LCRVTGLGVARTHPLAVLWLAAYHFYTTFQASPRYLPGLGPGVILCVGNATCFETYRDVKRWALNNVLIVNT
jgi:hypothetical protein